MIGGDEKKKLPRKADVLLKLDRMKAMRDGTVPPGRYSLNDAVDMIEARRAETDDDEDTTMKKEVPPAPADSTRFQKFKARVKEAVDPKRVPEGNGALQSKFRKAAQKSGN